MLSYDELSSILDFSSIVEVQQFHTFIPLLVKEHLKTRNIIDQDVTDAITIGAHYILSILLKSYKNTDISNVESMLCKNCNNICKNLAYIKYNDWSDNDDKYLDIHIKEHEEPDNLRFTKWINTAFTQNDFKSMKLILDNNLHYFPFNIMKATMKNNDFTMLKIIMDYERYITSCSTDYGSRDAEREINESGDLSLGVFKFLYNEYNKTFGHSIYDAVFLLPYRDTEIEFIKHVLGIYYESLLSEAEKISRMI